MSGSVSTRDNLAPRCAGDGADLEAAVAVLRRNFGKALDARVRTLTHETTCTLSDVTLRVHYPSFRDGECTLADLVDVIALYIAPFALPRSEVEDVHDAYGKVSAGEYDALHADLHQRAVELFKKAQISTNRNGEAGELLLCLLTEWILDAPQILAKMALKTNPEMPVHGSDGIHVRFCAENNKLLLLWGESKLYTSVTEAIVSASESIKKSLQGTAVRHELSLVRRYIDFSGLSDEAKKAIKSYLNPFDDRSNERVNVITCLIGFDFKGYTSKSQFKHEDRESRFQIDLQTQLQKWAANISEMFQRHGVDGQRVEIFLFPLPSVAEFRKLFQQKIGWNPSKEPGEGA